MTCVSVAVGSLRQHWVRLFAPLHCTDRGLHATTTQINAGTRHLLAPLLLALHITMARLEAGAGLWSSLERQVAPWQLLPLLVDAPCISKELLGQHPARGKTGNGQLSSCCQEGN